MNWSAIASWFERAVAPWVKGLLAAFISASANAITVTVVDPTAFNFGAQWKKTATVALVGGIFAAAGYLAKSPLPETPKTEEIK